MPPMLPERNKTIARRYFKAYETGDITAVMEFIAPSYVLYPGGNGKPMNSDERKRDEIVFFSAFSHIHVAVENQIAEDNKVANRVIMRCTQTGDYQGIPATGKSVIIPYLDILQIKAEKIVAEWVEFDMASIIRQISASKDKH